MKRKEGRKQGREAEGGRKEGKDKHEESFSKNLIEFPYD